MKKTTNATFDIEEGELVQVAPLQIHGGEAEFSKIFQVLFMIILDGQLFWLLPYFRWAHRSTRVMLALQALSGIHFGIDNLTVLRGVAKLIDTNITGTPLHLSNDGDF